MPDFLESGGWLGFEALELKIPFIACTPRRHKGGFSAISTSSDGISHSSDWAHKIKSGSETKSIRQSSGCRFIASCNACHVRIRIFPTVGSGGRLTLRIPALTCDMAMEQRCPSSKSLSHSGCGSEGLSSMDNKIAFIRATSGTCRQYGQFGGDDCTDILLRYGLHEKALARAGKESAFSIGRSTHSSPIFSHRFLKLCQATVTCHNLSGEPYEHSP